MIALIFAVSLFLTLPASAQDRPVFSVSRIAADPPVIDGSMEDDAWKNDPIATGVWLSYDPLYGEKQQQRTEVRITYDDRNIYFGFHCYDSEAGKIRTTISRRDNAFMTTGSGSVWTPAPPGSSLIT